MAAPVIRRQPSQLESSTRIKRADEQDGLDERSALDPAPPTDRVKMKIPRGMPVLPGGRRMPPLPVRLRESLAPLRKTLAPLRKSLTPLLGVAVDELADRVSEVAPVEELRPRRWPLAVAALILLVAGVAAFLVLGQGP